ncbi:hypothetical protein BGX21_009359 [Mortierella sp. AD011]|nr:hypothetical protein BGX20_000983 [Mortierella sp. AD010]KAF9396946.1 hypothetical protein BGX21_009359 [Mortierella sp. AD011]
MTSNSQTNLPNGSAVTPVGNTFNHNQNMSEFVQVDRKVFFAAAERNKEVILDQLRPVLDKARLVLEVGSGSGQHVYRFSKDYPEVTFQPTEYDTALLPSIDAYANDLNNEGHHINPALELDATKPEHWQRVVEAIQPEQQSNGGGCFDLVMTTNVFHISPWIVGQSIVRGAGQMLKSGGSLVIYGPFKKDGVFNTESNREFDATLRGRDPSWGVRDVEEIEAVAKNDANMKLDRIVDMPANNYMLFFRKQ